MSQDSDFEVEKKYHIYELKSIMDSNTQALDRFGNDYYSYPYDGFDSKKEAIKWLEEETDPWEYQNIVILSTLTKNVIYE